ncbi:Gfo/Idh/MocA family protein [Clostridium beijerinckii]|jgi:Predicted dehydrogenases and related proteins|uniref:Gfo/Idh/MocA family oxidoreductase n=2 Tax=Clostridium beijerinckii TaxID=1520 RepID=A0AAE2RLN6_CLOBE|nr:Gfo/Idh/MocA family oxidoreductase [Clostridium beijerinckii]ABR32628.1 oxidoreductase domain protein [Clostridium beijerinckii NCIMB 8052]AIU02959.1 oxidoreductase domain-containing protein [Clostridium beijerinckii ATCC 35702]MBF7807692.1 Gfo/Idh/MocA family oxidoreductase [Clostridium beijerinckii]NOW88307.1 putative dehydrogenase [Clostridium beijerinckii]NRT26140.1 putative dehydrogenase [Clostridium beijerinckii]
MIRWGIIGLGNIALRFAKSLSYSNEGKLYAIASRTKEKRDEFYDKYNCEKVYENYNELLRDEEVDAIYIALPHGFHKHWSIEALRHKKAVLCEKPVGINSEEMKEIKKEAVLNNTFFMEAMKTRFIPIISDIKKVIRNKEIGDITAIEANFCNNVENIKPGSYLLDKDQGGALLDVGIYPLSFVMDMIDSEVKSVKSYMDINESGVDSYFKAILSFEDGVIGTVEGAIDRNKERTAIIRGTKGWMEIPMYNRPNKAVVNLNSGKSYTIEKDIEFDDMYAEIKEIHNCLKESKLESDYLTLNESIRVMEVLDRIRMNAE